MSLILLALTTYSVFGQTSATNAESVKATPEAAKNWSAELETTFDRDLLKTSEADHASGAETSIKASYKTAIGSFSLKTAMYKNFVDERKETMNDSSISYNPGAYTLAEGLKSATILAAKIPTSEQSKDYATLRTGLSVIQYFQATQDFLKLDNITAVTFITATKNFHEFKTALTGKSNTSHSVSAALNISYSVTDKLAFTIGGTYMKGWTYENNTRDLYSFAQSVGYEFNKNVALEIGHELGGTPLSASGKSVELDFFSERDASIFTTLTISI